ncbi:hypothetical protein J0895_09495 [Phormidium pseudopriestleyi FRX01]|uniref:Uncharacterized protein n=1 Tax=Phormidium pseudopriestleyi FRX01 TaxID=1759528 RepID=A0ABS3FQD8_9CYAN|nr:hypothetical protein [Phormidium pseudopriestleyi]MBO0349336.1 hypothetical protein [Phormidium pseudopriestleyi FRX01]
MTALRSPNNGYYLIEWNSWNPSDRLERLYRIPGKGKETRFLSQTCY